jgi:HK97 family phage portal protein
MILRNMFKRIFDRDPTEPPRREYTQFASLNNSVNLLAAAEDKNYRSLFVRMCIDAIAENGAKLKPKVIRKTDGEVQEGTNPKLQRLLEISPNEYMSAYEFLYKVITLWACDNNAFIYIKRHPLTGDVEGLYPLAYSACEFLEAKVLGKKELFVRFTFRTGFEMAVPYGELVHLRRFFAANDLFGESNDVTLSKQVGLLNTVNKGFAAAVNSANFLRGIIKFTQNLKENDLKAAKERFVKDYINLNNNGGVAALDSRADYIELKNNIVTADNDQMKIIRQDIMSYFHLSENILLAKYNEDEWAAFYESVVEPIAIRLGLELTRKLFSQKELAHGNQIVFEANRLQYTSATSKINLLKELMPMGLLTINEGREVLNLSPIEGGDKRIMSLNYIDADKANEYQLNQRGSTAGAGGEGGGEPQGKEGKEDEDDGKE